MTAAERVTEAESEKGALSVAAVDGVELVGVVVGVRVEGRVKSRV